MIQNANAEANNSEYTTSIKTEVVSSDATNHILADYEQSESLVRILEKMGHDKNLVPSYNSIKTKIEQEIKNDPTLLLSRMSITKGNIIIKNLNDEAEKTQFLISREISIQYKTIALTLLKRLFKFIKEDNVTYVDDILDYMIKSDGVDASRVKFLKEGLKYFGREEYIAAIHILIFQVEGILRDILGKLGKPTYSIRDGEMRERMLSDVIDELEKVNWLDKDFAEFLRVFLSDLSGDNYRNNIGHGIAVISDFTQEVCEIIVLILIKIASQKVIPITISPTNSLSR